MCKKLLNLVQVALTKIPRNEAQVYQETEYYSSEGHLFNVSWLLPDLSFFSGKFILRGSLFTFNAKVISNCTTVWTIPEQEKGSDHAMIVPVWVRHISKPSQEVL